MRLGLGCEHPADGRVERCEVQSFHSINAFLAQWVHRVFVYRKAYGSPPFKLSVKV